MDHVISLEGLFHRSKERIRDLGEVFTPEKYVEDMLDLLAKGKRGYWANEDNVFFEPCCGHGNIVLAIYKRRLDALYKKSLASYGREASFYAVANAINTLWAIDIDAKNVENCRTRVLYLTLEFLQAKLFYDNAYTLIEDHQDFFAHMLAAVKWQIFENETLSSLSDEPNAQAQLTNSGKHWYSRNGHHKMEFDLTWAKFYEECETHNLESIEFEKAYKFIESLSSKRLKFAKDFKFAESLLMPSVRYNKMSA